MTRARLQYDLAELMGQLVAEERTWADEVTLAGIHRKIASRIRDERETADHFSVDEVARCLGAEPLAVERVTEGKGFDFDYAALVQGRAVAVLDGPAAAHYVTTQQARIVRSISGFDDSDTALRSNLFPGVFAVGDNLNPPNILWQLDTGEWVGVSTVSVGYGGEGPRLAQAALVAAGVSRDTADEISQHRFCDAVNIDEPRTWETSTQWPVEGRSWPQIVDGRIVIPWGSSVPGAGLLRTPHRHAPDPDPSGFYPSTHATPGWQQWLAFLDSDAVPIWAQGRRTAILFFADEQAQEHGYVMEGRAQGRGYYASPSVVIEQGQIQLWAFLPRPTTPGRLLDEDALMALSRAGFDTTAVERAETRRSSLLAGLARLMVTPRLPQPLRLTA